MLVLIAEIISPHGEWNRIHGIIQKLNVLSDFGLSTLKIDLFFFSNLVYNTAAINGFHLDNFLNVLDLAEIKSLSSNGAIIFSLMDKWILFENNTEIISNWREFFVSHFDVTVWEKINFVLFKDFSEHFGWVVEESSFDLCSVLIHQFNLEEMSTVSGSFDITFVWNSSFDNPVARKSV